MAPERDPERRPQPDSELQPEQAAQGPPEHSGAVHMDMPPGTTREGRVRREPPLERDHADATAPTALPEHFDLGSIENAAALSLQPGDELCGGRFAIHGLLGEGGMGVVFEAQDRARDQRVALKTLPKLSAAGIYRLKQEFRSLAGVVHSSLVNLHELFSDRGSWFFTMELVHGVPFNRFVRPNGQLDDARLRSALSSLVEAVDVLHKAKKLHRDLKPTNVLVRQDASLVILDFGLVSDSSHVRALDLSKTEEGVVGTPLYMAPEQATADAASEASDWYAVGVMLYEALAGRTPHVGSIHQVMVRKVNHDAQPPTAPHPLPEDLVSLAMALLRREPDERPGAAEILRRVGRAAGASPAARPSLPIESLRPAAAFVGRQAELGMLRSALAEVELGRCILVQVHGESGIGKSSLARELLRGLPRPRSLVLSGRCYERESVPYKAFDEVFDALSRHLRALPIEEAAALLPSDPNALAQLFPVLRRVEAMERIQARRVTAPDATEQRRRGFVAVRELFARLAHRHLLVVHVDDLQWGDEDSTLLLAELLKPPDPPPALFIAAYRSQRADALLGRVFDAIRVARSAYGAHPEVRELALQPLRLEESTALARTLLNDATPEVAERLAQESAGSPFLLSELAHERAETGTHGAGPLSIHARILERVRALPESSRALARVVAVASRPLPRELSFEVAGIDRNGLDLPRLITERVLRSSPGSTRSGEQVECYHDRIREAIVDELDEVERKRTHLALAAALERFDGVDPERLAFHLLAGGEAARGAAYAARAAHAAFVSLAFIDSARLYELALTHGAFEGTARRELLVALGQANAAAGRGPVAARAYLEAASDAPQAEALQHQQRAAELLLTSGHVDEGLDTIRGVLARFDMGLAKSPRAALLRVLWLRARLRLRGLSFRERAAAEVDTSDLLRVDACWSVAVGLTFVDPVRAAEFQTRHLLSSLAIGEPYRVACGLGIEAGFTGTAGRKAEQRAAKLSSAARALAERVADPQQRRHAVGVTTFTTGMCEFLVGRFKRCHELMDEAERTLIELPAVPWELHSSQRFLINCKMFMGDIPGIEARAAKLMEEAKSRGNLYVQVSLGVRLTSLVWMAHDDVAGGAAAARELMARWSQGGFHLQHYNELLALAGYDVYAGDTRAALARTERTWPELMRSLLMRTQLLRAEASFFRGRIVLAAASKGDAEAAHNAELDLRRLRSERLPWIEAMADLLEACLHAHRGDDARALEGFSRAAQSCGECDLSLLAHVACHREGELRGGDEGSSQRARAKTYFDAMGIRRPEGVLRLFAPSAPSDRERR